MTDMRAEAAFKAGRPQGVPQGGAVFRDAAAEPGQAAGFSAVLAGLDGLAGMADLKAGNPQAGLVSQEAAAEPDQDLDLAADSAGLDGAAADLAVGVGLAPKEALETDREQGKGWVQGFPAGRGTWKSTVTERAADAALAAVDAVAGLAQAPWMDLVTQTAQLDRKADADLRQGVAGDFLSGRGNASLLAQRQMLAASSHAAFMAPGVGAQQAPAARATDADGSAVAQADTLAAADEGASVPDAGEDAFLPESVTQRLPSGSSQALSALRAEHAGPLQQAGSAAGLALHGMTAVQAEAFGELRELWRQSRQLGAETGQAAAMGVEGVQGGHGIAAALGGAQAGAQGQPFSAAGQPQSDATGQPATQREQEVSEQVAFWVHQKNQSAALSVEHEGKPIQVQVQLDGQQAHVRFAADDAAAREWLSRGEQQLRELLQAQGLQLAQVSVGGGLAGDAQAGDGNAAPQRGARAGARMARVQVAAELPQEQARRGAAGATGVDLFV